jgi:hypothetical protein
MKMRKNSKKITKYTLSIISFITINSFAMDSVINSTYHSANEQGNCTISMHTYWEPKYANNIDDVKNLTVSEIVAELQNAQCLPKNPSSLEHLLYLSTVQKGDTVKTPFSSKQQCKFDNAFNTRKKVSVCFWMNAAVIAVTALFGYSNFAVLSQCSQTNQTDCISQISAVALPSTITCIGALIVGFTSLYATGILPDISARKADKIQDKIGSISSKYLTLAKYWIDIYCMHPDKARDIANRFDMDALQTCIALKTYNAKSARRLLDPLKEAWHYIMTKHILITFTEIENYLYSKINAQQNQLLSNRIDELEFLLREKDQKIQDLVQGI